MSIEENLTRDEAREREALLGDLHYEVELDLTGGDVHFGSSVRIAFSCANPGASTFLDLTAHEVTAVILNGEPVAPEAIGDSRVRLDGLEASNHLEVVATMAYQHEGRGLHFFRDPADEQVYLHSQFEPFDAHLVYACFDQPDLKGTFDFTVDARAGWVVVSNMAATEQPAEGAAGHWRFETTPKLSTYVTAIVAGGYHHVRVRHGEIDMAIYARESLMQYVDRDEIFELTQQGLDWFTEVFDQPYPFGKYDQLWVPEFNFGAMENPGCVTFSESYLFRSKVTDAARESRANTILHEMAHMWFGDLVTMAWWNDLWLNESFATFMALLSQVSATRFDTAWVTFLDSEKAWAKFQDQLPSTHPIADDTPDIESVHQNFDGITYAKGASVLRQLVAWVGQDEFLEGCRRYFRKHAYGNAELSDFLGALEDASGRDLDGWTEEWLRTTGINTMTAEFTLENGAYTSFAIVQTADGEAQTLRRHRVAVGVYDRGDGGIVRTERVEVDVVGERTEVQQLVGTTAGSIVLVNDDDLTYTKVRLDAASTEVLTDQLDEMVDPLPRALVWSSTWDMVRDADLASRRMIDLVVNNTADETEVGVLQRMLQRAVAAAERYGAPDNREAALAALATAARAAIEASEPGSDVQLAWTRHWAACARDGEQLADLQRLLEGDLEFPGLALDLEMRWHLVTCLVHMDAVGDDVVVAELERDPTDFGERHAATARASRPSAAAKEAAFTQLIEDTDLTHTMSRQLFRGFQQLDQPDVLAPFVERYFAALAGVWADRSLEWAIDFTSAMFPHALAGPDLLERTDAYLADDSLPRPQRRAMLEERDQLVRTIAARTVDTAAGAA